MHQKGPNRSSQTKKDSPHLLLFCFCLSAWVTILTPNNYNERQYLRSTQLVLLVTFVLWLMNVNIDVHLQHLSWTSSLILLLFSSVDLFLDKRACLFRVFLPPLSFHLFLLQYLQWRLLPKWLPATLYLFASNDRFSIAVLGIPAPPTWGSTQQTLPLSCACVLPIARESRDNLLEKELSHPFFLMPFAEWKHQKEEEENSKLQSISLLPTFSPWKKYQWHLSLCSSLASDAHLMYFLSSFSYLDGERAWGVCLQPLILYWILFHALNI